jgi:hypothetical protein
MARDRDRGKSAGCFLRALMLVAVLAVIAFAVATFYTGAEPKIRLEPSAKGIGRNTPIFIHVDDAQQASKIRVELIQGMDVKPVTERQLVPRPAFSFGPAKSMDLSVAVGRDTVKGLRSGEATVRVTVDRVGSLLRTPDPVVAEVKLPVRLAPPTVAVLSTFH